MFDLRIRIIGKVQKAYFEILMNVNCVSIDILFRGTIIFASLWFVVYEEVVM